MCANFLFLWCSCCRRGTQKFLQNVTKVTWQLLSLACLHSVLKTCCFFLSVFVSSTVCCFTSSVSCCVLMSYLAHCRHLIGTWVKLLFACFVLLLFLSFPQGWEKYSQHYSSLCYSVTSRPIFLNRLFIVHIIILSLIHISEPTRRA